MNNHLFIIAKITPKTVYFNQAQEAILGIVESTLKEPGCRQFNLHQGGRSLYLYEEWISQEALDKHYAMPYITPVFKAYEEWLESPVEIHKLTRLI